MQRFGLGIHNTLIAGYDNGGIAVIKRFKNFPELGYNIRGIITNKTHQQLTPIEVHGNSIQRYSLKNLGDILQELEIDRVFVPSADIVSDGYSNVLELCKKKKIKLKVLSTDADCLLRLIVIIALSPLLIITAAAIFIETGTPILFKQRRAAVKEGKTFNFYKFRSMIKNADEMKDSLFDMNEADGALFKIKDDPRMTKVGKFIRRYSIDELPQLLNVLKGEMSIVGPRPLPINDLEKLQESEDYWKSISDREKVKTGITGIWQVSGRSKIGFREMIWLDLYYVENQSLLFDLEIIFATIPAVLFRKGAY
jgi:lipopolysaccharide/colanic/teichoic acid biosynthesis glycosyltransferase